MSGSPGYFLDTEGNGVLGVGVCDRCKTKRPLLQLVPDPNAPGLRVCKDPDEGCLDVLDPYRLPARSPDKVQLPFNRPDQPLTAPTPPDWSDPLRDG